MPSRRAVGFGFALLHRYASSLEASMAIRSPVSHLNYTGFLRRPFSSPPLPLPSSNRTGRNLEDLTWVHPGRRHLSFPCGLRRLNSSVAAEKEKECAGAKSKEGDEEVAKSEPPSAFGSSSSSSSPGAKFKDALENARSSDTVNVSNYWGITPKEVVKEDGTRWPWHCFKPKDTYNSDTKIDLGKHHIPDTFIDKLALWTVKALRWPTDLFFQKRYGCRAMMLETVAAVPGMVGGMLLHLRSLRRFEHSGGWIKALLDEAENERMHLMTFMEVAKPVWYERALVVTVQGIFFNAYFILYVLSPRLAHRVTGYLEEEAIYSYTQYLKEIDNGHLPNIPAPAIAIDYWRLPKDATIRDVVVVVRADEAHHRDVNHYAADIHEEGKKLNESPAPVDYH